MIKCITFVETNQFMKIFKDLFGKKDMHTDATFVGQDKGKNYWYLPNWVANLFGRESASFRTDFDMTSIAGKDLARQYCFPFAMVTERCGNMMQNGKFYVVDKNDNERRSFAPIRALLESPNIFQTGRAFLKQVEINLKCFGFCPVYMLRATSNDVPKALVIIPPTMFHLESTGKWFKQTDKSEVIKRAYISFGGREINLEDEEYFVIHDGNILPHDSGDEITFQSCIDSISPHTRNYMAQIVGRGNLIVNGGPKGILYGDDTSEAGNAAITPTEAEKLNQDFKRKYGIVNKLFEIMVTTKKVGWINVGANTGDLKLHEEDDYCIRDIANAIGLQPDLFTQGSTFDNKEAAKRASYQDLIIPDANNIAEAMTRAFCPDSVFIKIDLSEVSCLQEDLKNKSESVSKISSALSTMLSAGMITVEEARIELSNYIDIDPSDIPEHKQDTAQTQDKTDNEPEQQEEEEENDEQE